MKMSHWALTITLALNFAVMFWSSPAHAQVDPTEATVVVVDTKTQTDISGTTNLSTITAEAGGSVTLDISMDQSVNGDVEINVFESQSEKSFTRSSTGEVLVDSQCSIRLANDPVRGDAVTFTVNDTTPVSVLIEPRDDAFIEDEEAAPDGHYCEITITRRNPQQIDPQVVVAYTVNIDDSADDTATINLYYSDDIANEGEPPLVFETEKTPSSGGGERLNSTEILVVFTAPVDTATTFTWIDQTPTVCVAGSTNPFPVPANVLPKNGLFNLTIVMGDVKEPSLCEIEVVWNTVPTTYPTNYDPPDVSFTVLPGEDANRDGIISPSDAMFVINRDGNIPEGEDATADVNGDGNITVGDVEDIQQALGNNGR